jgi:hypothetical protein
MGIVQHAALHVQGQHIVWQQDFIEIKDTFLGAPLSNGRSPQYLDASHPKM